MLALVEKWDSVSLYLYQIAQRMPRQQGKLRDAFLEAIFKVPGLIYQAAKSGQKSRVYMLDAALAEVRWYIRFLSGEKLRLMSKKQAQHAGVNMAEIGAMVGAWIKKKG